MKIYEYVRKSTEKPKPRSSDSLAALIEAYQRSPEWNNLSASRKALATLYGRHLRDIAQFPARDLTRRELRHIRDEINAKGTPGAANMFLSTTRAMLRWAVKADWLDHNPAIGIEPIAGGHLPAWSQDQAKRAMAELPAYLSRLVLMALYTGQRRGDLCRLEWTAYDGQTIKLVQSKTKTALTIPVHPTLKAAIDTWPRNAPTILTNAWGRPMQPSSVTKYMQIGMERLGMPGLNVHGLRKLAAANLADAGCTPHEIAAVTGHKSLSMVSLYTASADQAKLAGSAIQRLADDGNRVETEN